MPGTTDEGDGPAGSVADFLRSVVDAVGNTTDAVGAMQWAVDAVCAFTGWPLGHVFMVDGDKAVVHSHDVWHVDDPGRYAAFIESTRDLSLDVGEGLPGRVLESGEPAWVPDLQEDDSFPRSDAAGQVGLVTAMAFPVKGVSGVAAVMEFFAPTAVDPDPERLNLVAHVGIQLGHLLDRNAADEALRQSEARLAEAERIGRAGSWSWTVGDQMVSWSAELYHLYDVDPAPGPVPYETYLSRIHPADRERVGAAIERILTNLAPYEHEYRVLRQDGSIRWVHARIEVVAEQHGVAQRLTGYCQDVTERRLAEDQRRLAQMELESHQRTLERIARAEPLAATLDGLCRDIEQRYDGARCSILLVDPVEFVLHHAAAPSLPDTFRSAIDGLPIVSGSSACGTAAARNEIVVVEDILSDRLTADFIELAQAHQLRAVWSHPLATTSGEVIGTFAVYRSAPHRPDESEIRTVVTSANLAALALERRRVEDALTEAASIDPLTGLPNRAQFLDRLQTQLTETHSSVGVMFVDLDGFKWINDSLGHPAGDRILVEVAKRLAKAADPHHLARFGGDEFTVMVAGDRASAVDIAERLADRIHAAFLEPFVMAGGEFFVSCCVGMAFNDHPADASGLIRDADAAMFSAKEAGRARRARFDEGMRARAMGRVTIEAELRRAIERDEFVMHYQPIVQLGSGRRVGVEALVRWQHPLHGLLPPARFIPLAEENGLIVPLGELVLQKVVRERSAWPAQEGGLYAAANVSIAQLADPTFGAHVVDLLRISGLDPAQLVIELTETAFIQQLDLARRGLEDLTAAGVQVLIDDFGTGYSSISRLGELPVAGIKIDNSFAVSLAQDPKAQRVVAAVADLAHALELEVVIEGIETAEAEAAARAAGCDSAQGYHLGRPAPALTFFPSIHS